MIKIDKGVPIPTKKMGRKSKYPWDIMEVGDSFVIDAAPIRSSTAACQANKKFSPKKFKCCTVTGRIWRIE